MASTKRQRRLVHLVAAYPALLPLLSITNPHADRNVFALEQRKLLLDFVLEYPENFLLEAVGEAPTIVNYGRVQNTRLTSHPGSWNPDRKSTAPVAEVVHSGTEGICPIATPALTDKSEAGEQGKKTAARRQTRWDQ